MGGGGECSHEFSLELMNLLGDLISGCSLVAQQVFELGTFQMDAPSTLPLLHTIPTTTIPTIPAAAAAIVKYR